MLLCWDLGEGGRTRLVPCLILPLASATIHEETENTEAQLGFAFCSFAAISE